MRLVCDKCSALYTIEDGLVGTRDFRVSCKSCGEPIYVRSARQVSFGATHRVRLPGAALPRPSILAAVAARGQARAKPLPTVTTGGETWFVSVDGKQRGPLTASEVANLLENGSLNWSNEVWREGLKGWRPARRDALLVTAVAGTRGAVNDTTRLDAARSFLAPEDTVVEPRFGHVPKARGRMRAAKSDAEATEKHVLTAQAAQTASDALPDLRPSARPQAWHSPENEAFREALGLPTDSSQQASQAEDDARPQQPAQAPSEEPNNNAAGRTLADAFVSATTLLYEQRASRRQLQETIWERLPERIVERTHAFYQQHINSHYLVAALSFGAGVLLTAMVLGRPGGQPPVVAQARAAESRVPAMLEEPANAEQSAASAQALPAPVQPEVTPALPTEPMASASPMLPVATAQSAVASALTSPTRESPTRELPTVEDLRREVRKVAPDVRRCLEDPTIGVDVDIYLSGVTGRVRDVDVRSPLIPPGRVACIMRAVRRMELAPFTRAELKLMHKFSW